MDELHRRQVVYDAAIRDAHLVFKPTAWDAGRTLAALLAHVMEERHPATECQTCAKAEVYVRVLNGALHDQPE